MPRKPPAPNTLTSLLLTLSATSANDSSARAKVPRPSSSATAASGRSRADRNLMVVSEKPPGCDPGAFITLLNLEIAHLDDAEAVLAVADLDLLRQVVPGGVLLVVREVQ